MATFSTCLNQMCYTEVGEVEVTNVDLGASIDALDLCH